MGRVYSWKSGAGFTLVELLVVIAIVGILAGVLVTLINPDIQLRKSRDTRRKSDLSQISTALEFYRTDLGLYPLPGNNPGDFPACGNSLTGGTPPLTYMEKIPCDPLATVVVYPAYDYSSSGTAYSLIACLENGSDPQKDSTNVAPCNGTSNFSYTVKNL